MIHSKGDTNLTLLIRHLPREFSDNDRLDFLQHFGAVSVRNVCIGGKNNEAVFATFSTPSAAKAALMRLHQMEVLGCHLSVEYSRSVRPSRIDPQISSLDNRGDSRPEEDNRQRLQDQFMRRLVSWSSKLNLSQPPPSHLHYQYPPPTPATLSNISRALSMHPRLYTQLLHLMNRMNLPPPFQAESRQKSTCNQETQTEIICVQKSSSESEMESEEEQTSTQPKTTLHKRPLPQRKVRPIKRPMFIKPPAISESSSSSNTKPEEVFEKPETCMLPKKIEVRLGGSLQFEKEESEPLISLGAHSLDDQGGFGVLHPPIKANECRDKDEVNDSDCQDESGIVITAEQLASNRVPKKDLQVLPVFKNYSPGVPSCRLYVKNISKHAVARDLHFIYGRYSKVLDQVSEESNINMFDVRLMTEGRMKGQAFITLPTVTLAEQALLETNGYILKEKPLVVQFARSAPALPTVSSTQ